MRASIFAALIAATVGLASPARAADVPARTPAPAAAMASKRVTARHYFTLEKMLRRFSREAGEARTRG